MMKAEFREHRAMLKDQGAKAFEVHGRQVWIRRADEVLVKPLRLFDLEADTLDRGKLLLWEVDDESHA